MKRISEPFVCLQFFNSMVIETFPNPKVPVVNGHKHLGMILDSKLDFSSHVKEAIIKARRETGMIRYMDTSQGMYVTKIISSMSNRTFITAILYIISMILNLPVI